MKINSANNRALNLKPFGDFRIDVDNLFDHLFGDRVHTSAPDVDWTPRSALNESESAYQFVLELPGVAPESVSIELKNNRLEISGEKVLTELEHVAQSIREERHSGKFCRQLKFSQQIDTDAVAAEFKNGLLTVDLPKAASVLPKKIEINVAQ